VFFSFYEVDKASPRMACIGNGMRTQANTLARPGN